MKKKFVKSFLFETELYIKWIDISLQTAPCMLNLELQHDKLLTLGKKQILYTGKQKTGIQIQENFKIYTSIEYDTRKDRFITKKIDVNLMMTWEEIYVNKSIGRVNQDLSFLLNDERTSATETKKLIKCIDNHAKINCIMVYKKIHFIFPFFCFESHFVLFFQNWENCYFWILK